MLTVYGNIKFFFTLQKSPQLFSNICLSQSSNTGSSSTVDPNVKINHLNQDLKTPFLEKSLTQMCWGSEMCYLFRYSPLYGLVRVICALTKRNLNNVMRNDLTLIRKWPLQGQELKLSLGFKHYMQNFRGFVLSMLLCIPPLCDGSNSKDSQAQVCFQKTRFFYLTPKRKKCHKYKMEPNMR